MPVQKVLSYDLGGTKIAVGVVDAQGKVLDELRVPARIEDGKKAVFDQLTELGKNFLKKHPGIRKVGVASAGPIDPVTGVLLDPTNFASREGTWGKVPLARILSQRLKKPVALENDAAAAIIAEHWRGAAKGCDNAMILTLGTGLGTGVIANGKLVRAGHHLHTEAGHLILRQGDSSAPCGCGNLGCAEAYLSGRNFGRRIGSRLGNPGLTAKDIAELARNQDPRALAAFEEYAELMAVAIHNYAVIYAPEIVVFTGSFAEAADLFLPATREHLKKLLARRRIGIDLLPVLKVSKLKNNAGLIGGAWVAFHSTSRFAR
jgi:glucokinase